MAERNGGTSMEQDETREILRAIPLFGEVLDSDQIDALAHKANPVVIPAGAVLMEAGDFGISMFVIVSGFVSVSFTDRHGDVHDVADLGPGNVVGEMSLLTGARRSASVTALEEVSALEITKFSLVLDVIEDEVGLVWILVLVSICKTGRDSFLEAIFSTGNKRIQLDLRFRPCSNATF